LILVLTFNSRKRKDEKDYTFILFAARGLRLLAAAPANAQTTLFDASTNVGSWLRPNYKSHRIPAITKLSDGTLMVFADYRDGVISIVAKQSTDNGSTWGNEITVAAGNSSASDAFDYAHGDAAVVTDRESGVILMMCASGKVGYGNATDYSQSTTTNNGLTCTDDKDNLYQILDFTKEATASTDEPSEMEGYAIKFAFTDKDGNSTFRLVALGVGDSGYELNWLDHTTKGTTDVASTSGKCWSTDFIFTEVPFAEPDANGNEVFVTDGKPSHSGFPVTFYQHDEDYTLKSYEDWNKYATLNLPYAVELPVGVTAYKVSEFSTNPDKEITLTPYLESKEGNLAVLPRETPVLLSISCKGYSDGGKKTLYMHPALAQAIVETGFKARLARKTLLNMMPQVIVNMSCQRRMVVWHSIG